MSQSFNYPWRLLGQTTRPSLYMPLTSGRREIRLCHISQQDDPEATPDCSLSMSSLNSSPKYSALSYVWGDESVREDIIVNGQRKSVTYNLSRALRNLQKYGPFDLWIDALCINQQDPDEKSDQVAMMGDIYRSAEHVIIWLGDIPETDDWDRIETSDIFRKLAEGRCLEQLRVFRMSHDKNLSLAGRPLKLLKAIVSHPWFTRAWVVQEVVLAKRVFFQWGYAQMPYIEFMLGAIKLAEHVTSSCCREYFNKLAPGAKQIMDRYMDVTLLVAEARSRHGFKDWSGGTDTSEEPMTLLEALEDFRTRNAGDPRDKVFAFLALVRSWPHGEVIKPDYASTVQNVYISTAKHLISGMNSLVVLTAVHGKKQYHDLPSWVPDWSLGSPLDVPHDTSVRVQCGNGNFLSGPEFIYPPPDSEHSHSLYYHLDLLCSPTRNSRPHHFKALAAMYSADKNVPGSISFPGSRLLSTMGFNFGGLSVIFSNKLQPEFEVDSLRLPKLSQNLSDINASLTSQPGWAEDDISTARRWRQQFVDFRKEYMHESESQDVLFVRSFVKLMLAGVIVPRQSCSGVKFRRVDEMDILMFMEWLEGLDEEMGVLSTSPPGRMEHIKDTLSWAIRGRRPFITQCGYLGMGPEDMRAEDEVWVLARMPTPVILRANGNGRYSYVGDAFVLGLMDGEAAGEGKDLNRVFIE